MKQNNNRLNEHLSENDLKWLVHDEILIDMHKTKIGKDKDYMVLSIPVKDKEPAEDLARYIENSIYEYADVEVSPATDSQGRYLVYIELPRKPEAFANIRGILEDSTRLSGIKDWKFKSMGMSDYIPLDEQTFSQYVINDPIMYEQKYPDTKPENKPENDSQHDNVRESIKSRLKFLMTY